MITLVDHHVGSIASYPMTVKLDVPERFASDVNFSLDQDDFQRRPIDALQEAIPEIVAYVVEGADDLLRQPGVRKAHQSLLSEER